MEWPARRAFSQTFAKHWATPMFQAMRHCTDASCLQKCRFGTGSPSHMRVHDCADYLDRTPMCPMKEQVRYRDVAMKAAAVRTANIGAYRHTHRRVAAAIHHNTIYVCFNIRNNKKTP